MAKNNAMLAKIEAKYRAEYAAKFDQQMEMAMQLICDAAFFAANRMFHMGEGRVAEYRDIQEQELKWIIGMIAEDQKDDRDFEYAKAKVDERMKMICGKYFQPWEERYEKEKTGFWDWICGKIREDKNGESTL